MDEKAERKLNELMNHMDLWIRAIITEHNSPAIEDSMNLINRREDLTKFFISLAEES